MTRPADPRGRREGGGPTDPRRIAARALLRVLKDDAWAAALLDAEFSSLPQLDPRDRALATELLYGTLRSWTDLEARLLGLTNTKKFPDDATQVHMMIAAHQIANLERVPAFAAVDRAVSAIAKERGERVASFANAILRRFATEAQKTEAKPHTALGVPSWLFGALRKSLGEEGAKRFLEASAASPPVAIAVRDMSQREAIAKELTELAPKATVKLSSLSPAGIVMTGMGALSVLPGYGQRFWSQEEGSQVVALSLGVKAGDRVLDACAGRGHKSALLGLFATEPIDVCDLHASKLEVLREDLSALGISVGKMHAVDWSVGTGAVQGPYQRILLDAPCTGIGTLRRRPEIALRRTYAQVQASAALQAQMLANVAKLLAPGGTLVFAVCSVLVPECEDVVEKVLAQMPDLERKPFERAAIAELAQRQGQPSQLRLLPQDHDTDGYFMCSLGRKPGLNP